MTATVYFLPRKPPAARDEDHAEQLATAVRALAERQGHRPPRARPVLVSKQGVSS